MIYQLSSHRHTKAHFFKQVEMRDRMLKWEAHNLFEYRLSSLEDAYNFYKEMFRGDYTYKHPYIQRMAGELK
jgi:hypothetical protein